MTSKLFLAILSILSVTLFTCSESELTRGERLAKTHCASCHLFPDPSLLDKKTWETGVMPQMAFRMGLDYSSMFSMSPQSREVVLKVIPGSPIISIEEFNLIKKYYNVNAPNSLQHYVPTTDSLTLFKGKLYNPQYLQTISLVKADTLNKVLWFGDRASNLFKTEYDFQLLNTFKLGSPASSILLSENSSPLLLAMGKMDPNDLSNGSLVQLLSNNLTQTIIDSLNRPVFIEATDFNNDKLEDYIICAFGNFTGALLLYQNLGDHTFKKHTLSGLPGSRKVIIKDFDNNGLQDIVSLITQGDEHFSLFLNKGDFKFQETLLLRFPPVYGSSYFEMVDINKDQKLDIIYSNGDNADFSSVLKPYHGIRIFLNTGENKFKEGWFYPMYGAFQTITRDFDLDGDLDIAAISFFPDFKNAKNGFLFLENQNNGLNFKAFSTPLAASGRWMRMESLDIDADHDIDLIITALKKDRAAALVLNNLKH